MFHAPRSLSLLALIALGSAACGGADAEPAVDEDATDVADQTAAGSLLVKGVSNVDPSVSYVAIATYRATRTGWFTCTSSADGSAGVHRRTFELSSTGGVPELSTRIPFGVASDLRPGEAQPSKACRYKFEKIEILARAPTGQRTNYNFDGRWVVHLASTYVDQATAERANHPGGARAASANIGFTCGPDGNAWDCTPADAAARGAALFLGPTPTEFSFVVDRTGP